MTSINRVSKQFSPPSTLLSSVRPAFGHSPDRVCFSGQNDDEKPVKPEGRILKTLKWFGRACSLAILLPIALIAIPFAILFYFCLPRAVHQFGQGLLSQKTEKLSDLKLNDKTGKEQTLAFEKVTGQSLAWNAGGPKLVDNAYYQLSGSNGPLAIMQLGDERDPKKSSVRVLDTVEVDTEHDFHGQEKTLLKAMLEQAIQIATEQKQEKIFITMEREKKDDAYPEYLAEIGFSQVPEHENNSDTSQVFVKTLTES